MPSDVLIPYLSYIEIRTLKNYWHGCITNVISPGASMNPKQLFRAFFLMTRERWQMASVVAVLLAIFGSTVWAFPSYDGCQGCHGRFESNPYTSLHDGTNWGINLMQGHFPFMDSGCLACHKPGGRAEVFLNFSGSSNRPKGCVGAASRRSAAVAQDCGSTMSHRSAPVLALSAMAVTPPRWASTSLRSITGRISLS